MPVPGRNISPPAGALFYRDCQDILSRLNNALARVQSFDLQFQSSLRVSCSDATALTLMDQILRRFQEQIPEVHVNVFYGDPVSSIKRFFDGEADVVMGAFSTPLSHKALRFRPLMSGRYQCVLPEDSPLKEQEAVAMKDLNGQPLILLEKELCSLEMHRIHRNIEREFPGAAAYCSNSDLMSAKLVQAGLGIAVMPDYACPSLKGITTRPLAEEPPYEYGLIWRKKEDCKKIAKFADCAQEALGGSRI